MKALFFILLAFFGMHAADPTFFIIVPTYNNASRCIANIVSVVKQSRSDWHLLVINDNSSDDTGKILQEYVNRHALHHCVTILHNKNRCGALFNIRRTVMAHCPEESIVVLLDGDDELFDEHVLERLAREYTDPMTWITYGQYVCHPSRALGVCRPIPEHVMQANSFRRFSWVTSHLRTFKAWLFKKIREEDLVMNGLYYPVAWDLAIMLPMLEMASKGHIRFISDYLYRYHETEANDYKVRPRLIPLCEGHIRSKRPYQPLDDKIS